MHDTFQLVLGFLILIGLPIWGIWAAVRRAIAMGPPTFSDRPDCYTVGQKEFGGSMPGVWKTPSGFIVWTIVQPPEAARREARYMMFAAVPVGIMMTATFASFGWWAYGFGLIFGGIAAGLVYIIRILVQWHAIQIEFMQGINGTHVTFQRNGVFEKSIHEDYRQYAIPPEHPQARFEQIDLQNAQRNNPRAGFELVYATASQVRVHWGPGGMHVHVIADISKDPEHFTGNRLRSILEAVDQWFLSMPPPEKQTDHRQNADADIDDQL